MIYPWDIKLQRAEHLFSEFSNIVSEYFLSNPAQLEQILTSEQQIEAYLHIHKQPPVVLASLFGEIIHNLRSALDSLVYILILQEILKFEIKLSDYCRRRIQFPIEIEQEDFKSLCYLKGLESTRLYEDLKSFQPFIWGLDEEDETKRVTLNQGHHLASFQYLSNLDKHKGINFVFCKLQDFYVTFPKGLSIKSDIHYEEKFVNDKRLFMLDFQGVGDPSLISVVPRFGLSLENNLYGFPGDSVVNKLETFLSQTRFYVRQLSWHLNKDYGQTQ